MIKSRRMGWAGHVAGMGRRGMHVGYWWEIEKERDHWEEQDVGWLPILKCIIERLGGMIWIGSILLRRVNSGELL
jgi:hypothetical protein